MSKYYLTVGFKYAAEKHPFGLHPNGWCEIECKDYEQARELAVFHMGSAWAFMYDEGRFKRHLHPLGCMKTISLKVETHQEPPPLAAKEEDDDE